MQPVPGLSTGSNELDELEEIARLATRTALEALPIDARGVGKKPYAWNVF